MSSTPIIRSGTIDDATAIAAYQRRGARLAFSPLLRSGGYDDLDDRGRVETFLAWLRDGSDFVTTVADLDGTAVGHVTINGNELVHLFVDPDHQGLGLGRMLLAAGEEMLAAAGHIVVELHTMVGNAPAIELYESAGWIVTDGLIHTDETEMSYDEHVLVKHLGGDGRPMRVGPPPRR